MVSRSLPGSPTLEILIDYKAISLADAVSVLHLYACYTPSTSIFFIPELLVFTYNYASSTFLYSSISFSVIILSGLYLVMQASTMEIPPILTLP